MKIGVVGMGFVGNATALVLERAHEIIPYDKYKGRYKDSSKLKEAEVIFNCVPTPKKPSGEIDLSAVHDSLKFLTEITKNNERKPLVVIRSTVVPGTVDELRKKYLFNFASNPEFLREKYALEDMRNTKKVVIGAYKSSDHEKIVEIYKKIFPDVKFITVDPKTAEMIKYSANIMLIGQIAVANELYQICKIFGVDYDTIKEVLLTDKRMARNIDVPGHDGDFGFGGTCFPKDLNAMIYKSKEEGYAPSLLEEVWALNNRVRENKDWLETRKPVPESTNFNKKD